MIIRIGILSICLLLIPETHAFSQDFSIGVRVSTLGFGSEFTVQISHAINARLGFNAFSYGLDGEETENEYKYEADLQLQSFSALIDWYCFKGIFKLSSGLLVNQNLVDLEIVPTGSYEVGARTYYPKDLGRMTGEVKFDKLAPYFGIGWGNPVSEYKKWGFVFDLGMIYQNSCHVDFEAVGMIAQTADQDKVVEKSLEGWKAYGVISLGLTYKLF